jgi:hypothetical protein
MRHGRDAAGHTYLLAATLIAAYAIYELRHSSYDILIEGLLTAIT